MKKISKTSVFLTVFLLTAGTTQSYDRLKTGETAASLRSKAEQGDAESQYKLGYCCLYRLGGADCNIQEALKWFRKAATQNYGSAAELLGVAYEEGHGVDKDQNAANTWYHKALAIYSKEAEQGNTNEMYNLGELFFNGRGVEKNSAEGIKWFRKAAEMGNAVAARDLGRHYVNGEKNPAEGIKWYRKAAEMGDAVAARYLGWHYVNGTDGEKNPAEGYKWYRKAVEMGDAVAARDLGWYYEVAEKNPAEGFKWYRKAAEMGNAIAAYTLGDYYQTEKNYAEACKWYEKSYESGIEFDDKKIASILTFNLGLYYLNGVEGVDKDLQGAVFWFGKSHDLGHPEALDAKGVALKKWGEEISGEEEQKIKQKYTAKYGGKYTNAVFSWQPVVGIPKKMLDELATEMANGLTKEEVTQYMLDIMGIGESRLKPKMTGRVCMPIIKVYKIVGATEYATLQFFNLWTGQYSFEYLVSFVNGKLYSIRRK